MEVITLESKAFAQLLSNLENLTQAIQKQTSLFDNYSSPPPPKQSTPLDGQWLDNEEVCKLLKVTKRTLQNYRDNLVLPYSQIGKKILYKSTDVQKVLEQNYIDIESI